MVSRRLFLTETPKGPPLSREALEMIPLPVLVCSANLQVLGINRPAIGVLRDATGKRTEALGELLPAILSCSADAILSQQIIAGKAHDLECRVHYEGGYRIIGLAVLPQSAQKAMPTAQTLPEETPDEIA